MAQGTGLPIQRDPTVTPTVDFTRTAGMAGHGMAANIGALNQSLTGIGDVLRAHERAVDAATLATQKGAADQMADEVRARHLNDPEGFSKEWSEYQSGLISSAPSRHAMELGGYVRQLGGRTQGAITLQTAQRNHALAGAGLETRLDTLTTRVGDSIAGSGGGLVALNDPAVQQDIGEFTATADNLVKGGFWSREQADAKIADATGAWKAGAVASHAVATYKAGGLDAALKEIQGLDDPSLQPHEMQLARAKALNEVNQAAAVDQEQRNNAHAVRSDAEQAIHDKIKEDVGQTELNGKGSGLKEDDVRAVLGSGGVADWLEQKAQALEYNRRFGNLGELTPEQAAARIASAGDIKQLPSSIGSDKQFDAFHDAIQHVETRNGANVHTSSQGAEGLNQMLPDTARRVAQQHGVAVGPDFLDRLKNDPTFNDNLSRLHQRDLLTKYGGDPLLSSMAYFAGEGNVDSFIKRFGDPRAMDDKGGWLSQVANSGNPKSAQYVRDVAQAMKGGKAQEAWDRYTQARLVDPAGSVADSYPVAAAAQKWAADTQAGKAASGSGFNYVQAVMRAQERAGIKPVDREPLPRQQLQHFVDQYHGFEARGQEAGPAYLEWQKGIMKIFRDPDPSHGGSGAGPRVLQAILKQAGASDFSARVGASIAAAPAGSSPDRNAFAASAAVRAEAAHRAATGQTVRPTPNEKQAAFLRDNRTKPEIVKAFDDKFGSGSAARILGGR